MNGRREKPPGGFPPDADPADRCDLCDELGAGTPATVHLPDVALTLTLCPGCEGHLEDAGTPVDPDEDDDDRRGPGTYTGP